jgi:enolase
MISRITARPILDSRGEWTLVVRVTNEKGESAIASVPHGKSAGSHEAVTLPADRAVRNVEHMIAPHLVGANPQDQEEIDRLITHIDPSDQKKPRRRERSAWCFNCIRPPGRPRKTDAALEAPPRNLG